MYEELKKILVDFKKRIQRLENAVNLTKLIFPSDGTFVVPKMGSDPSSPQDGEIWYNTTSHKYKGQENGTIVTFTTS